MAERREACDTLCQKARTAKNEGWPDHADLLLNEAVRQRPDDLEARRQIAETMWDCGRPQESIAEYKELIQLHPKDARLHQRLAVLSWTVGQQDQAAQAAEQALRLDPTSPEALLVKGRAEVARKEFDNAVATYIRLVRAAPDLIEAKVELAEVHVERGHSRQACALLREVIALPKLSPILKNDAEWKLGLTYASADRWAEAATHLGNSMPNREASAADVAALSPFGSATADIASAVAAMPAAIATTMRPCGLSLSIALMASFSAAECRRLPDLARPIATHKLST